VADTLKKPASFGMQVFFEGRQTPLPRFFLTLE
jgi:hypothetical protein